MVFHKKDSSDVAIGERAFNMLLQAFYVNPFNIVGTVIVKQSSKKNRTVLSFDFNSFLGRKSNFKMI